MLKLHIANTFFEWELETHPQCGLSQGFLQHPIFRQLQFLPVLYADPHEGILLADRPEEGYSEKLQKRGIVLPKIFPLTDFARPEAAEIESWGPSQLIAAFADRQGLIYDIPEFSLVRRVNSKQFSFEGSPKLPHATLLSSETQTKHWLGSFAGKKVLKTCYGVSGKGHLIIEGSSFPWERTLSFLKTEWNKELPVIAEPWVDRTLDFSTQWFVTKAKEVIYIGSTLCENDARGQYRSSIVGEEKELFGAHLPFLQEHLKSAHPIVSKIAELGFFGNLGIDAMVYTLPGEGDQHLHPAVEINARKTMGWALLMYQRRNHPNSKVKSRFANAEEGYLPQAVTEKNGKRTTFKRNLAIEVYN